EVTCTRVTIGDREFKADNFTATKWKQSADIMVQDQKRGSVEVHYLVEKPESDEGPFLTDERKLLDSIARMLGTVIEGEDANEALCESEERNRLLLDSAGEAIYGLDIHGNCTFANITCLQLLGYSSEADIRGKNMHGLMHYKWADGTPYPKEECKIYQAFRCGEGVHVDGEVLWRADGSAFPAEYWSYPIHKEGDILGAVVVFTDITERKAM
ncbi:PAS domain S-box protein, partial [Chloroflexota bacterium]